MSCYLDEAKALHFTYAVLIVETLLLGLQQFLACAALTAPLPYTASKGRKPAADKDNDLPRAILFDVTNEANGAQKQSPAKPPGKKAAEVQSIALELPDLSTNDARVRPGASTEDSASPVDGKSSPKTNITARCEALPSPADTNKRVDLPLSTGDNGHTASMEELAPVPTSPSSKEALNRCNSSVSQAATWGTPSTVASAGPRSPAVTASLESVVAGQEQDVAASENAAATIAQPISFTSTQAPAAGSDCSVAPGQISS